MVKKKYFFNVSVYLTSKVKVVSYFLLLSTDGKKEVFFCNVSVYHTSKVKAVSYFLLLSTGLSNTCHKRKLSIG